MIEKMGYHALRNVPDTLSRIISKVDELVDAVNRLDFLHAKYPHVHSKPLEQEKLAKVGMCIATLQDLEDELRKGSIE